MRVWFKVVGNRLPYGTCGRTVRRGSKRTLVDFGKHGQWQVPNAWLCATKPDPMFGQAAKLAYSILAKIAQG